MKADPSQPHSVSQLKSSNLIHVSQRAHINGHHFPSSVANRDTLAPQENLSEDEEESDQEEEEEEDVPRKWQGIEAIFEAYQEYVDGESVT